MKTVITTSNQMFKTKDDINTTLYKQGYNLVMDKFGTNLSNGTTRVVYNTNKTKQGWDTILYFIPVDLLISLNLKAIQGTRTFNKSDFKNIKII